MRGKNGEQVHEECLIFNFECDSGHFSTFQRSGVISIYDTKNGQGVKIKLSNEHTVIIPKIFNN